MIKHLVVFGDSTTRGSELTPQDQSYGELLKDRFGFESIFNYGCPASGPQHLVIQFKNFLKQTPADTLDQYLAIFWIGGVDRAMIYNREWMFLTPTGGFAMADKPFANVANEQYFKYFYSQELAEFNLNTSLITLQSMCKQYSISDYYLPGWQSFNCWPEVNLDRVYAQGKQSFYDLFGLSDPIYTVEKSKLNVYIRPNLSHPNQLGHQLIADTAYKYISNRLDTQV